MPIRLLACSSVALPLLAQPACAQAAAPELGDLIVPHRAVYEMSLARSDDGSGVSTASGRMVFEITGGACAGYSMRQRMVVDLGDEEGNLGRLDFRITTFESGDGDLYNFDSRTTIDDKVVEAVKGEARRQGSGIEVKLVEPTEKTVQLNSAALFPSQHLRALLDAAQAERTFVSLEIYEGAGTGEASDAATASIGPASLSGTAGALREGVRHWPVSVGYFEKDRKADDEGGEETPAYQMQFRLYENGVTSDLVLDYGTYALSASLSDVDPLPAEEGCSSN